MNNDFFFNEDPLDRVDGRQKVTGSAKYAAEYEVPNTAYGVLVGSTITRGRIKSLDTKKAEGAPGVLGVLSYKNAMKVPGYVTGTNPGKPTSASQPLRIFYDNEVLFNGHPIALVVADTYERARYAARLVKANYEKDVHQTNFEANIGNARTPTGPRFVDYVRGEADAYKSAPVKIEGEYIVPVEVHNPMEMHATLAIWEGEDKVLVYDKNQGVKPAQRSIMDAFNLPEENVRVISPFVGGGFGSALRTWPHAIAALIAAKQLKRPVKLMLTREQMFMLVGYRPYTIQKMGIGATADGKLVGMSHQALGQTSSYEEFTEGTVQMSRMFYNCPNVNTTYKIVPLHVSTPTWMRGPGEATGSFAVESAMDELAYALKMDPLELRLRNYAETDPERKLPFSSKFLKEAYEMGAAKIGWHKRNPEPRSMRNGEWLVGYGMGSGIFNASRGTASARALLKNNGTLVVQTAVSDIGPGTGTAMVQIAADVLGIPPDKIVFELGDSNLPPAPNQGGSTITSTVGSAVHEACMALKQKLQELATKDGATLKNEKREELVFKESTIRGKNGRNAVSYTDLLKQNNLTELDALRESKGGDERRNYAMYSFSVHFTEVHVHPLTGVVKVVRAVTVADSGKIVSPKTAESQMIGGVVGGIGMALTEGAVMDHRFGRYVTKDFADYHVPVHADVPHVDVLFVNKPDPYINPMGAKGMGEIAIVGYAAAIANAIFHATGKRIRELPITPDKLI